MPSVAWNISPGPIMVMQRHLHSLVRSRLVLPTRVWHAWAPPSSDEMSLQSTGTVSSYVRSKGCVAMILFGLGGRGVMDLLVCGVYP